MSKKYLIYETEKWAAEKLTGRPMSAKEVEVLDDKNIDQIGFDYDNESSLLLSEILKAKKYLIVKLKD